MKYSIEELKEIKDYGLVLTDTFVKAIDDLKEKQDDFVSKMQKEKDKKEENIKEIKSLLGIMEKDRSELLKKINDIL